MLTQLFFYKLIGNIKEAVKLFLTNLVLKNEQQMSHEHRLWSIYIRL